MVILRQRTYDKYSCRRDGLTLLRIRTNPARDFCGKKITDNLSDMLSTWPLLMLLFTQIAAFRKGVQQTALYRTSVTTSDREASSLPCPSVGMANIQHAATGRVARTEFFNLSQNTKSCCFRLVPSHLTPHLSRQSFDANAPPHGT